MLSSTLNKLSVLEISSSVNAIFDVMNSAQTLLSSDFSNAPSPEAPIQSSRAEMACETDTEDKELLQIEASEGLQLDESKALGVRFFSKRRNGKIGEYSLDSDIASNSESRLKLFRFLKNDKKRGPDVKQMANGDGSTALIVQLATRV